MNPEPVEEVRHVPLEPKLSQVTVNDQAIDGGEGAAKEFPVSAFKLARHIHLWEEVIMPQPRAT
jgi:hypothetical protein